MDPTEFLRAPARGFPGLDDAVRREVESLLRARNATTLLQGSPDCPFAAIETYLTLVVALLPKLAERLQEASLVEDYINEQIDKTESDTDLSDFGPVTLVCKKEERLRSLAQRLQRLSEEFSSALAPYPSTSTQIVPHRSSYSTSPLSDQQPSLFPNILSSSPETRFSLHLRPPGNAPVDYESFNMRGEAQRHEDFTPRTPQDDTPYTISGSSPLFPRMELSDMAQLDQRGKGSHTCPHALRCSKGGVDANGGLVIFERNSAFKAHLQKHERPFKCDKPGCPNRRGFARIDQLRRHQTTTHHKQESVDTLTLRPLCTTPQEQ